MNPIIKIDGREISNATPPYIVAELSANHNGSKDKALEIIQVAAQAGADAVKLQTYTPDTITIDSNLADFQIVDGLWAGRTLYELYEWAHTPWEWHADLFAKARKCGITMFSSPFDNTAVDFLEDLGSPAYKIASFEVIDLPLIKYAASTGKPLIMSTGMANMDEISEAIEVAQDAGCKDLAILHCVSAYPAPSSEYNLTSITELKKKFDLITGLSDHTLSNVTAIASIGLGAKIIEKHVTLDRKGGGADDSFSLEPQDLEALVRDCKTAWQAMGVGGDEPQKSEIENLKYRRSLYFIEDLPAGTIILREHIKSIRPGFGIAPKNFDSVLGRALTQSIHRGTPVSWELFET